MAIRRRRGGVALGLFAGVLILSLCARYLANDKPLLLNYRGHVYMPVIQRLPEQTFGAQFLPGEADYHDPAVQAAIQAQGWMIWPPIPYRYDSIVWSAGPAPAPPSWRDWLGTDDASRDVLARVLYGLRSAIMFGFGVTFVAAAFGILAGGLQGFYGGAQDLLFQRFTEIWSGLPQLFLLMLLASLFAPGFFTLLVFLALFSWMGLAGLVRAEFLRGREMDYVRAARAMGASDLHLIFRHILPNASIAILSYLPFMLGESITLLASLDFLGLGLPPDAPSLGGLVATAENNFFAPWLGGTAFAVLGGLLLLLILMGEAARERLNPRRLR